MLVIPVWTAGDLVARLQLNQAMKIDPAKKYVADKLGVSMADLADPVVMRDVREDMDLGVLNECPVSPKESTPNSVLPIYWI